MRILPSFVARAAVMWLLVRLALFAVASAGAGLPEAAADPASSFVLSPPAVLLAAGAVTALVLIDVAALHERAFIANLGVDRRHVAIAAFATALALEVAVTTAGALLS